MTNGGRSTATPLFQHKLRFGTLGDRFLAQELELIGWRTVLREDGKALEVGGISDEAIDEFSTRCKELRDRARELAHAYERKHGHPPGKRRGSGDQAAGRAGDPGTRRITTRRAAGQQLAAWARQAERSGAGALAALHEAAETYAAEHEPSELPSEAERRSIIRQAVAAVQTVNAAWNRAQLIFELGLALPALPGDVDPEAYLNELADEALSARAEGVSVHPDRPGARRDRRDPARAAQGRHVASTGRPAKSGSSPASTSTLNSTWWTWPCCRSRSGSRRRPRRRRWPARTWIPPSARPAWAC